MGAAIGTLTAGNFVKYGKKNCIHGANLIVILGAALTLVRLKEILLLGRFIYGLAAGSFCVFVPSYISEITPTELRGTFGSST